MSISKTWIALICSLKLIKSHMILSTNKNDYTNHRLILRTGHPENHKDCSLKSLLYESIEESDMDYLHEKL
ncbi:hypothetical protein MTR67_033210 [Solanum verrucosum]|uniref:Uncharacterized protein n=1 Tax=Solanum verrucosum TaxID=315347 RepID=A0AAF0U5X0_SOLVR|nr:hypothetical protein MTR67_033210 [Solanum verrucosum]